MAKPVQTSAADTRSDLLRLAIQRSGRLSEKSLALLLECGLQFSLGKNKLKSTAENFPLELLFLRDDDIPRYVDDGVADIGIVGRNVIAEKECSVEVLQSLGFARCRLAIAVPRTFDYRSPADLDGMDIATSHPRLLADFLRERKIDASIHEISGSVEIAPSIGLAQAVCDIVSSGSTLMGNGLREVETVFRSEAVLIANPGLVGKKQALADLLFRMRSVLKAKNYKYILLNIPDDAVEQVVQILPGMKSPTIMPLSTSGWSSVHSVIKEEEFWQIIEHLKEVGAQGILVVPIEKMIL